MDFSERATLRVAGAARVNAKGTLRIVLVALEVARLKRNKSPLMASRRGVVPREYPKRDQFSRRDVSPTTTT